ncbi:pentapeptide repeat-containing protein [Kushneria indalinina]|uniref:Pentapeptide repeat protein n=1 Tax=Kushneria indalinina DSM 14324 TaxID=1122140 RepID=A0A3D9DTX8_9GAMM|nr:pentapeptide repeat-containing protein [Kushneria indalinina]REC94240.1 pentapeptide repeat protein [Kushneria indalinina DSM 14324]
MSANDRNRYAFSYVNHDVRERRFIYKNFNRSSSYRSNFSSSSFVGSSFVGVKFKFCSFYKADFKDCLIRGTLFRKCNFQMATFTNCLMEENIFNGTKLESCKFVNCKIIGSPKIFQTVPEENFEHTEILNFYSNEKIFSDALVQRVEQLRSHDYIRRSSVLHRKKGKINALALKVLVEEFDADFLIKALSEVEGLVTREFYTLSYIQSILRKLSIGDKF